MARTCQNIFKKSKLPVKVVENSGVSIKKLLVKSNPFKENKCDDPSCPVCTSGSKINCQTREVCYENICQDVDQCNGRYDGETADEIKKRFGEHVDAYRLNRMDSVFYRHCLEKHNGEEKKMTVDILGICHNDPMLRQCMEAVAIRDRKPELNGRGEWGNTITRYRR